MRPVSRPSPAALVAVLSLALGAAAVPAADRPAPAYSPAWDALKSLVGEWTGEYGDSAAPARVSYTLVSGGTAVMERMQEPDGSEMITVYHPDGDGVLLTHYCSTGNQPRMRLSEAKGNRLRFDFVDGTNLGRGAHEMRRLVLTLQGPDLLLAEWTSRLGDKEEVGTFRFTRQR
jgi:hypothetical protein